MTADKDVERILERGRVETTGELDARVLAAARRGARRRGRLKVLALLVPAAAVLLLAAYGAYALIWLSVRTEPRDESGPHMTFNESVGSPGLYTYYTGVAEGDGWIRLEDGEGAPAAGGGGGGAIMIRSLRDMVIAGTIDASGYSDSDVTIASWNKDIPGRLCGIFTAVDGDEEDPTTEAYDAIVENAWLTPRRDPLSTFSIDVDTASYANVRRILREGRLPPPGAVRIEEFVNTFDYEDPEPDAGLPFSVTAEVAACPWRPAHRLVRIGLRGRSVEERQVPSRNLVFLLDVSGSMQSADKLPLVRESMKLLVERLRPEDTVGIVVYAGASGVVLEPTSDRTAIRGAIDRLSAGGSTNGGEGIKAAYGLARRSFREGGINRVILATDGDFNVGTTNRSELTKLIETERESGVFLTVLGVGTGNVKDSQMEMLADKGNGNYAYLDSIEEARKVLVREASATLVTIAKDVKIQVEFNPLQVGAYRLIGYENRVLAAQDFNDDRKDAGEIGAGHSVTALYEIAPAGEAPPDTGAVDPLRYQERGGETAQALTSEVLTVKLRYKEPDGDTSTKLEFPLRDAGDRAWTKATDDFRFAASVAAFGMLLRDSAHRGEASFALVHEMASGALGTDPHGDRAGFLRLVEQARRLTDR